MPLDPRFKLCVGWRRPSGFAGSRDVGLKAFNPLYLAGGLNKYFLQTVKTQIKCSIILQFHRGRRCLYFRQNNTLFQTRRNYPLVYKGLML